MNSIPGGVQALLCFLVCMVDGYDMTAAPLGVPYMAADWGLGPFVFSTALASSILGLALGSAMLSPLGDRFGRRLTVITSFTVVGILSLLVCLTADVISFAALRFIIGLGLGTCIANAIALASEHIAIPLRSRVVTGVSAASSVGAALGGFAAPSLVASLGWRGIFLVGGGAPLLLFPVLLFGLKESPRLGRQESDGVGARSSTSARSEGVIEKLRTLLVLPYRQTTILLSLFAFLSTFTVYMFSSWLPTLMRMMGWSMSHSMYALGLFGIGGIIGGFVLGWIADRGVIQNALLTASSGASITLLVLALAPSSLFVGAILIVCMGAGSVGAVYTLNAIAAMVYPTFLRATGIGAVNAAGRFGAVLAPILGGLFLAHNMPTAQIMLLLAGCMGVVLTTVIMRGHRIAQPIAIGD